MTSQLTDISSFKGFSRVVRRFSKVFKGFSTVSKSCSTVFKSSTVPESPRVFRRFFKDCPGFFDGVFECFSKVFQ